MYHSTVSNLLLSSTIELLKLLLVLMMVLYHWVRLSKRLELLLLLFA
jgi:hypothetical protein